MISFIISFDISSLIINLKITYFPLILKIIILFELNHFNINIYSTSSILSLFPYSLLYLFKICLIFSSFFSSTLSFEFSDNLFILLLFVKCEKSISLYIII